MTVVLVEGFDHLSTRLQFGTKGWQFIDQGTFVTNNDGVSTGRLSGQSYYVATKSDAEEGGTLFPTSFEMIKALPSTYMEVIVGFAAKRNDNTRVAQDSIGLQDAAGSSMTWMGWDSSNRPMLGGTSAVSSFVAVPGAWNYYEIRLKINGTSSEVELRINGGPSIPTTIFNAGTNPFARLRMWSHYPSRSSTSRGFHVDDIYIVDTTGPAPRNTFLGDCRVETIYPTAEGAFSMFIPSTGTNNAALVDEVPPNDDADYVSSATAGDIDTNVCNDLTSPTATVYAVQTNLYAKKESAGSSQISPVTRQAGTTYPSATVHTLSTTYSVYSDLKNQDPTAADWTVAKVNADEFGMKVIT